MEELDVGGVRCSEVLDVLSDFVDGDIDDAMRTRVEAHLQGCENCARFGKSFGGVVEAMRSAAAPAPLDEDLIGRLKAALNGDD
ncbi:MAG: hypothetical protein DRJ42_08900 [Deltaproteobacteria bacterium]|nr:MAG: hypothetical protein DRJ42_08900 [Deltaproteobacteria bacterium]